MSTILQFEPPFVELLRSAGLTDFDAFMRAQAGPSTSLHKTRETAPLDLTVGGAVRRFFIKRNFRVPPKHALGPLLRFRAGFSQPRAEWDMLGRLREAGIPAMGRVAMGERRVAGVPIAAFLLVEKVPLEFTLEHWLVPGFPKPERLDATRRCRLLHEIGRLVRALHDRGFRWPDIHPKHIFTGPAACAAGWQFCLIDVERMTQTAAQAFRDAEVNSELRILLRGLRPMPVSRRDLEGLWAGYHDLPAGENILLPSLGLPVPEELPRLPDDYEHPRAVPLARHNYMDADRRALGMLSKAGIDTAHDAFHITDGDRLVKAGLPAHRDRLRLHIAAGNGSHATLYVKRFVRPPATEQFRRMAVTGLFRGSAYHETRFIRKLMLLGIPTLRALAFWQEMTGPWERQSFAVTEGLHGISLEQLIGRAAEDRTQTPDPCDRREIIHQLALMVRLLHANRLFHRDLYLCHVFLTRNAEGRIVLRLIDLARMIEKPIRTRRWRIKDLASLDYSATAPWVTRADRLRFVRIYYGRDHWRGLLKRDIAAISARAQKTAHHDLRRRARSLPGGPA